MQRAGAAAAAEIMWRHPDAVASGVLVLAGSGNNGGDAWVVARALVAAGARVRVIEPLPAKTDDAIAERALAASVFDSSLLIAGVPDAFDAGEGLVVDGLLGTGSTGAPRGAIADAIDRARTMRARGATIVALDVPSGVDASNGTASGSVTHADLTLTFGTLKRAHVVNREACGTVVVLDIGLGTHVDAGDAVPLLVDELWVAPRVPRIGAASHKGTRKKLAIVGGAEGMAGATVLAARAAMRSGIGMVKLVVADASLRTVQESEPYALASVWPNSDEGIERDIGSWADAVVIGPGLGRDDASRAVLERVLRRWRGPTLLDADGVTLFEERVTELADALSARPAVITPHPAELARLTGSRVEEILERRFDVGRETAAALRATVLLKGTPTVIANHDGQRMVSATGTPALATAGSGDVLSGIVGTLLAQTNDPFVAAAIGAWIHGRASERVPMVGASVRGLSLDDVVSELRNVWTFDDRPTRYPVLAELPELGAGR